VKVIVNSKIKVLKSFLSWIPLALACAVFYGVLLVSLANWLLENYFVLGEVQIRQFALILGVAVLILGIYGYITWITYSLSSYGLKIDGDKLFVKGKNGWRSLDVVLPINTIKKIYYGQNVGGVEQLTFFAESEKSFKLDFVANAFDKESLYEFLVFAKSVGIDTNVSV